MANWKLGNLGNVGDIIPRFLISKFSILPFSQNRKLGFKILGKNFRAFQDFRVVQVFYLAQLELEYLNQKRWWDLYVCFMILLNVQHIMLNKFNRNSFRNSDLTYFLAEQNHKEMRKTSGFTKISLNRDWLWNICGVNSKSLQPRKQTYL